MLTSFELAKNLGELAGSIAKVMGLKPGEWIDITARYDGNIDVVIKGPDGVRTAIKTNGVWNYWGGGNDEVI